MSNLDVYSVWFMPEESLYSQFSDMITVKASELNSPVFEPHVTIISDYSGSQENAIKFATQAVSKLSSSIKIKLTGLTFGKSFYQCVFFKVLFTAELSSFVTNTREIYGHDTTKLYMPHLSLVYGDFDTAIKLSIISNWGITITSSNIEMSFSPSFLAVYRTGGSPTNWQMIERIPI